VVVVVRGSGGWVWGGERGVEGMAGWCLGAVWQRVVVVGRQAVG